MAAEKRSKEYGRTAGQFKEVALAVQRRIIRALLKPATLIMRSLHLAAKGQFKTSPLAEGFAYYAMQLQHVELSVTVGGTGMGDIYPVELFKLQDNIGKLTTWLPTLMKLVVEVNKPGWGAVRRRMQHGGLGLYSSMPEEMRELVKQLRTLEFNERYVCFRYREEGRGGIVGMTKDHVNEVVSVMMHKEQTL